MTVIEVGEYMKDVQSEINDAGTSCEIWENDSNWCLFFTNLHKWTGSFHEIDITISRIDMIFDLDLELKLITAWIGYSDLSLDRFIDWNELKNAVTREKQKSIPRIRSLEVKIGFKLPPLRKNDIEINFPDLITDHS